MSDEPSLQDKLRALVSEALSAGEYGALATTWRELAAESKQADLDKAQAEFPGRFGMIGDSPQMHTVYELIEKASAAQISVLINGETGTGKELVARALHDYSPRAAKPFLAENCAAVPANLLESELFGHVKGAFTGAIATRKGTFLSADKGTVFLDEIGDMPLEMQSKLLRVLQNGEVRAVGSNAIQKVDVRVVAATNKDLPAMCERGEFREDLYYRLNVITIVLPPLRERPGDVEHLARFIVQQLAEEVGRDIELTPDALTALEAWSWPGNVRELENELRRAAVFADEVIGPEELSPRVRGGV